MKNTAAILLALTLPAAFAAEGGEKKEFSCPMGANCIVKKCSVVPLERAAKRGKKIQNRIEAERVTYKLQPQANMAFSVADAHLHFRYGVPTDGGISYSSKSQDFTLRSAYTEKSSQLVSDIKDAGSDVAFFAIDFPDSEKKSGKARLVLLAKSFRGDYVLHELPLKCDE